MNKYLFRTISMMLLSVIVSGTRITTNQISETSVNIEQRPNIIFIEVDDLTYKYIGAFGKVFAKDLSITPEIDQLAEQGVLFKNAIVQGTMCSPSRNSTLTSRYPHNLKNYKNHDVSQMRDNIWTFTAALQRAGYYTAYIGKSHLKPYMGDAPNKTMQMSVEFGLDHVWQTNGRVVNLKNARDGYEPGKDEYLDFLYQTDPEYIQTLIDDNSQPTSLPDTIYLDGHFTWRTKKWLGSYAEEKPFFLWLNYSVPHGPSDQPADFQNLYDANDMPNGIVDEDMSDLPDEFIHKSGSLTGDAVKPWQADYASMITYTDNQLGQIIQALGENGFIDNTMIIFFSDHGLSCGDHGLKSKQNLYYPVLNACLIISFPERFQSGIQVTNMVELTDLSPTVLEMANASQADMDSAWGYSLIPLLEGKGGFPRQAAFAEQDSVVAMVTEDYKYVWHRTKPVLFNLRNDPDELVNVVEEFPQVASQMRAAVKQWKEETWYYLPGKSIDLNALNIVRSRDKDTVNVEVN